jgi:uncharacterized protein (TIGR02996 family)
MSQQEGLLQGILESPNDDAPRLVYADWLEEQGQDARADFIRVQCELYHLPSEARRERNKLEKREQLLLRDQRDTWLAPLRPALGGSEPKFERGFIQEICVDLGALSDAEVARVAGDPELVLLPWLAQHRRLRGVGWEPAWMRLLAACPRLSGLTCLDFSNQELHDEAIVTLVGSPYLTGLRELHLGFCFIGDAAVEAIARSRNLPALTTLDLGGDTNDGYSSNDIGPEGAAVIARSRRLAGLTTLSLFFNFNVGDSGLRALLSSRYLKQVTSLDLSGTGLTDDGVRALARSALLGRLRVLRLWNNDLGDGAAEALAASRRVAGLEELDLRGFRSLEPNEMGDGAARALAASRHLGKLRRLRVGHWRDLTDAGAAALRNRFGAMLELEPE